MVTFPFSPDPPKESPSPPELRESQEQEQESKQDDSKKVPSVNASESQA